MAQKIRKNSEEVFFKSAPLAMIKALYSSKKPISGSALAEKSDLTYSHIHKLIKVMKGFGLIQSYFEGRSHAISLSKKGREVGKEIVEVTKYLK